MIILNSGLKSLEVLLAAAVTTTELDFVASFVDLTITTFTSGEQDGTTNGTTAVTCVSAPSAQTQRQVKYLSVKNRDTVPATVTLRYNNNGVFRHLVTATLEVGGALFYTDGEGFRILTTTGALFTSSTAIASQGTLLTADPSGPADDTWWVVREGTSPTMTASLKARIAGTTYTIASITL